mmetsp:Transcript_37476/g.94084  ORF Transcript_37476/g.94084 Transcript_37476/m.94084 type:complete len:201 (+) Transcript_37476:174-776(+)
MQSRACVCSRAPKTVPMGQPRKCVGMAIDRRRKHPLRTWMTSMTFRTMTSVIRRPSQVLTTTRLMRSTLSATSSSIAATSALTVPPWVRSRGSGEAGPSSVSPPSPSPPSSCPLDTGWGRAWKGTACFRLWPAPSGGTSYIWRVSSSKRRVMRWTKATAASVAFSLSSVFSSIATAAVLVTSSAVMRLMRAAAFFASGCL